MSEEQPLVPVRGQQREAAWLHNLAAPHHHLADRGLLQSLQWVGVLPHLAVDPQRPEGPQPALVAVASEEPPDPVRLEAVPQPLRHVAVGTNEA